VEGDAEEILIPIMVKKVLGVSLDELGISLVNIRSTGFQNVAVLFHALRIRKRCSIITDLDATFTKTNPDPDDAPATKRAKASALAAQAVGIGRKNDLVELTKDNEWLEPFFAPHTFEVDFVQAGNNSKIVAVLNQVYKDAATIATSKVELESQDIAAFGTRALTMANNAGKGWFAILVGKVIDHHTVIPAYILNAIFFAHGPISRPIVANMLSYRLQEIAKLDGASLAAVAECRTKVENFRQGGIAFAAIRSVMLEAFPADEINNVLAGL
jgi:putative ATP-dependent endonuclease of OLD family